MYNARAKRRMIWKAYHNLDVESALNNCILAESKLKVERQYSLHPYKECERVMRETVCNHYLSLDINSLFRDTETKICSCIHKYLVCKRTRSGIRTLSMVYSFVLPS